MSENKTLPESPIGDQLASIEQWVRNAPLPLLGGGLLLVLGFLLIVLAGGAIPWLLFMTGLVVTTTSVSKQYNIGFLRTVGNEQVIDQWDVLIGGAQEQAEVVFEATVTKVAESEAPNIRMERREVAPGMLRGCWVAVDRSLCSNMRSTRTSTPTACTSMRDLTEGISRSAGTWSSSPGSGVVC